FVLVAVVIIGVLSLSEAEPQRAPSQALAERMALNLQATGVLAFQGQTNASGRGVRIAVIDTGVDPSHPALVRTPTGDAKIIDWVDLSGRGNWTERANRQFGTEPAEGDVFLQPIEANGDTIATPVGTLSLGTTRSQSGVYRVGTFDESRLPRGAFADGDVNGDGRSDTRFAVVAVDTLRPGIYDTVIVDGDGDLDLTGEPTLRPYRQSRSVAFFRSPDGDARVAFVVTDLHPEGSLVNLGFDANGHGTQVAGIAAGFVPDVYRGVAPGAQIVAIKALSAAGQGSWSQIVAATRYAVELGVDIINISVTGLVQDDRAVAQDFWQQMAQSCGCLIVLASGNEGPGIGSATTAGADGFVLTVGAFYTPEMVQWDFGYRPPQDGVWYFSGMGPGTDGALVPSLVAPGRAPGSVPLWRSPEGYEMLEGTSASAPHVAGAAALLLEAARRGGVTAAGPALLAALERGARPLAGYEAVEQGHGALDLVAAWNWLRRGATTLGQMAAVEVPEPYRTTGQRQGGVYGRGSSPGRVVWSLAGDAGGLPVEVSASVPWLRPERQYLRLGPGVERSLVVDSEPPDTPGLHTGWVQLDAGVARRRLLHTVIRPVQLFPGSGVERSGSLALGRWHRYFIEVPPGVTRLTVSLVVPSADNEPKTAGLVRVFGYRPDGRRWHQSGTIGDPRQAGGMQWSADIVRPAPGVWEWVVYAPFTAVQFGLSESRYALRFDAEGVWWQPPAWWVSFGAAVAGPATLRLPLRGTATADATVLGTGAGWLLPRTNELLLQASTGRPALHEFRVEPGTGLLEVAASVAPPRSVELNLYRRNASGIPQLMARGESGQASFKAV
ncbi:MAG TPA: S8 family serine peptidase, partial [Bacillota bacterium]